MKPLTKFMMNFKTQKINLMIILALSVCHLSCVDQKSSSSGSSGSSGNSIVQDSGNGDGAGNSNNNGSIDGNGGSGSTSSSCTGTVSDGQGPGTPIHSMNLFLAGLQDWFPQVNNDSLAQMTFITPQEASILFSSDSRLRIRFMVKPQPIAPSNQTYCYGRNSGVAMAPYNKLKFDIYLRDINCSTGSSVSCASGDYTLGPRYGGPITVGPIDVNSCSGIIDLGHLRNQSNFGTAIEVAAVKSDQYCEANNEFCPSEKNVRSIDCWQMTLQVVTDSTQDFK